MSGKINLVSVSLWLIFVLALFLRLFRLEELPAVLNRDEAALAYNAYLIRETGQDEWQTAYPLTFKSFGDYKLPGYPYLLAGLFTFLPLNDFIVRLPSAVAGSLLVILAFYLGRKIFAISRAGAVFLALLVAINPVFFFYSRIAFEANLALLLLLTSLLALWQQRPLLAILTFGAAVLTYNTPLLLAPFLFIAVVIFWPRQRKYWWSTVLALALITSVVFGALFNLTSQKSAITIFSDHSTWENFAAYRQGWSGLSQTLLGNKYVYYLLLMGGHALDSLSLDFLVRRGGSHPWHTLPGFGHLFYLTYFLALASIIDAFGAALIKLRDRQQPVARPTWLLLYLLIVSLAPSVVTVDSPHATRSLLFLFLLLVAAAMFFDKLWRVLTGRRFYLFLTLGLWLVLESYFYYQVYFTRYAGELSPPSLHQDYKNLLLNRQGQDHDQPVAVVDEGGYQYIVTAWYLRVPAADFFATMKYQQPDQINFHYGEQLLNYHFVKAAADKRETEKLIYDQAFREI